MSYFQGKRLGDVTVNYGGLEGKSRTDQIANYSRQNWHRNSRYRQFRRE